MASEYTKQLKSNTSVKQEYLKYVSNMKKKGLSYEAFGNWVKSKGHRNYKETGQAPEQYGGVKKLYSRASREAGTLKRAME